MPDPTRDWKEERCLLATGSGRRSGRLEQMLLNGEGYMIMISSNLSSILPNYYCYYDCYYGVPYYVLSLCIFVTLYYILATPYTLCSCWYSVYMMYPVTTAI
jgi:hypothetical protein